MKEKLLFEMYKDTINLSKKEFRENLRKKYKDVDIKNLHAKIVKYQIKKYGMALDHHVQIMTREDKRYLYERSIQRKYSRKKRK